MTLKAFARKITQPVRTLARRVRQLFLYTREQRKQIRAYERTIRGRMKEDPDYLNTIASRVSTVAREKIEKKLNQNRSKK